MHAWLLICALVGLDASIVGPDQAAPGDLVILSAKADGATAFTWRLADSDRTYLETDGGQRVVFASGQPGRYTFVLAAAGQDGERIAVKVATKTVVIGIPDPGPGPVPPGPPLPGPGSPLSKQVTTWATAVDSPSRAQTAAELAKAYRAISSQIAAGALRDPEQIRETTRTRTVEILGEHRAAWREFHLELGRHLDQLAAAGTLDYQARWIEIAAGLEAVR